VTSKKEEEIGEKLRLGDELGMVRYRIVSREDKLRKSIDARVGREGQLLVVEIVIRMAIFEGKRS
jgi:hypothetical protein